MPARRLAPLVALLLLAVAPAAGAQVPTPTVTVPTLATPEVPTAEAPAVPTGPSAEDLVETAVGASGAVLRVEGDPAEPSGVTLLSPDGAVLARYARSADGRASFTAAGHALLEEARFLRMEGAATDDRFTIVLLESGGTVARLTIEREVILGLPALPEAPEAEAPETPGAPGTPDAGAPEAPAPEEPGEPQPIVLARAADAPGGPAGAALARVEDERPNVLLAEHLDGKRFLQRVGVHRAILHVPEDAGVDRAFLRAAVGDARADAPFALRPDGRWTADLSPATMAPAEGATVTLAVTYERQATPLVVERYEDARQASYRVDGGAPSVSLSVPASPAGMRFTLSLAGADGLSGLGGFDVEWREAGAEAWQRLAAATREATLPFAGEWGQSYDFRARSLDAVGNPSPWREATAALPPPPPTATTPVAATPAAASPPATPTPAPEAPSAPAPPRVAIVSPTPGSRVAGLVEVVWEARAPDGTPMVSTLEASHDAGGSWWPIYSGTRESTVWDTTVAPAAGAYRLRLVASDGALATGSAAADYTVAPPPPPVDAGADDGGAAAPTPGAQPATHSPQGAPAEEPKDTPGPAALAALAATGAAALALRRRR